MNDKIKAHVNALFANAAKGSYVNEVKEELLANLNDKYNDMIQSGKSEDEAFVLVISGIGDIGNLLNDLGQSTEYKPIERQKNQIKRSIFISIGVALYILSLIPLIWLADISPYTGLSIMIIICAVATGFIVYGNNISRGRYSKMDNSFVEEYKEKVVTNNDRNRLKGAITSSMWMFIVVIYFAFSFLTRLWSISWIIFLIGACAQQFIEYSFARPEKRKNIWHGILWTGTVIVYFIISFAASAWAWSWMIFLLAAAVQQVIRLAILWKNTK